MPEKVKYKSKEYNKAYKNNQIANNYDEESDTYEYSLPEVSVNNRDTIIKVYNKANEYKSTVRKEFYNMVKSLVK